MTNELIRTVSSFVNINDKVTNNILQFMAHSSKNIYNTTVFHTNIFMRYQNVIFKKLLELVNNGTILDITSFDAKFYEIYDKCYKRYVRIKSILHTNNQIIYDFIKNYLKQSNIIITNNNFNEVKQTIIRRIDRQRLIDVPDVYKKELYLDIVSNILISRYNRSFSDLKDKIMKHIPCDMFDSEFIIQVKNNEHLFPKNAISNYKLLLKEHKLFKVDKNEDDKKKKKTIKSNQDYIARIVYIYHNDRTIPSDLMCNIIAKVYASFQSYFALIKNGRSANKPQFLKYNDHYILPFFKRSRRLIFKNNKWYYQLTVGSYIAEHYSDIINEHKYICLNPNAKIFKKYVDEQYLLSCDKKISRRTNFIIGNKYIDKESNKIFEANYIYVEKPPSFTDDKLKLIEISPLYSGTRFKINFTYGMETTKNKPDKNKIISIDPGMKNLFVIHDPHGEQLIVRGSHIKNINNYYGKKIDEHKKKLASYNSKNRKIEKKNKTLPDNSRKKILNNFHKGIETRSKNTLECLIENKPIPSLPKQSKSEMQKPINHVINVLNKIESGKNVTEFDGLGTSKRLRKLYLDRNNDINNYFNHLCNWLINKYSDYKTIIIGNNTGWKTNTNMGKKTNRNFYEIPYRKLFNKLKHQAEKNNQRVCIIEESYTSICDALALEEICYHNKYAGERLERGLFASSKKKYINADLNGAINIMRKWYAKNGHRMNRIRGTNIYNPRSVSLSEIMKTD